LADDPNYDFVRDPDEWKTGDEPITDAQREYLSALAAKAGEPIPRRIWTGSLRPKPRNGSTNSSSSQAGSPSLGHAVKRLRDRLAQLSGLRQVIIVSVGASTRVRVRMPGSSAAGR